jgi:hypothetical protein
MFGWTLPHLVALVCFGMKRTTGIEISPLQLFKIFVFFSIAKEHSKRDNLTKFVPSYIFI